MIHCYDYKLRNYIIFDSVKNASNELKVSERSVQRSISNNWLVSNRFLFDKEEIPNLEIEHKKPSDFFIYDVIKNEVIEFDSLIKISKYLNINYGLKVNSALICKTIERKTLCYKTFFCSRENDFSFIKKHRNVKSISLIYNINF